MKAGNTLISSPDSDPSSSGIVIVNTHNEGHNYCILVLQEVCVDIGAGCAQVQRRLVRPIPAGRNAGDGHQYLLSPLDPTNPFWKGDRYGRLSIGDIVSFGSRDGSAESSNVGSANRSHAHANEDQLCEVLKPTGTARLSVAQIYDKLAPLAEGDIAACWPVSAFYDDHDRRSIRANVDVPSVSVVRGIVTRLVDGETGLRADVRCGGTSLKNLPAKFDASGGALGDLENYLHAPGLLVLGLARNKYSAARAKCPIMLCEFYPEPEQVAATLAPTPLNRLSLHDLSAMMGILAHSPGSSVDTERLFLFYLTQRSPLAAAAMGLSQAAMKTFADNYRAFFEEHVRFYRKFSCCVVQFPTAADEDTTSLSVIVSGAAAGPRLVFAATLDKKAQAKVEETINSAHRNKHVTSFQKFLQTIVNALNQGGVKGAQGLEPGTCNESLTQAANTFVFEIWKDTVYADTVSPLSLPALRIYYQSELLQEQMRRVSIKKYPKHDIGLMFRINQKLANSLRNFQREFGFGQWDTDQKQNNERLMRQLKAWETQVEKTADLLKQMMKERRGYIAGRFTIPAHGALAVENQVMQSGRSLLQKEHGETIDRNGVRREAVNIKSVMQRCKKMTEDTAIIHVTDELSVSPELFSEKCRLFTEAFKENSRKDIRNFQIIVEFQNMVLETASKNPDFFVGHRGLHSLDEKTVHNVFEFYRQYSLAHRNTKKGRFSKHTEQQMSVEVLVGLCCCLFVYSKMSRSSHPDLFDSEYGPGMDDNLCKLQHLILRSKFHENIAMQIFHFIQVERKDRRPLFNLNHMQVTRDFCAKYTQLHLQGQVKIERVNDEARLKCRQDERERRDREIKRLLGEIDILHGQIASKQSELNQLRASLPIKTLYRRVAKYIYRRWVERDEAYTNPEYTTHMDEIHSCENKISRLNGEVEDRNRQITALRAKIDPVMSPLPNESPHREEVLGILYLPDDLRLLADFCVSAEATFLSDWQHAGSEMEHATAGFCVPDYQDTWVAHYNSHQVYTFTSPDLSGTQNIRNGYCNFVTQTAKESTFFSAFHQSAPSKNDKRIGGVWFPNAFERSFGWRWQGHLVNPFVYSEHAFLDLYQEKLNDRDCTTKAKCDVLLQEFMQVTFDVSATAMDRENLPLSEQYLCPEEWTEQQFQAFGSLRAFATPQTARNFVKFLKTQDLPPTDSRVHQAVRMMLFLTGPIAECSKLISQRAANHVWHPHRENGPAEFRRLWIEFEENIGFLDSMIADIANVVDKFREKRRDHHAFVLLIDLAGYFLPKGPGILTCSLDNLAVTCMKIAKEYKAQCDESLTENGDETKRLLVLVSQHLLYALSAYLQILRCRSVHGGHIAKTVNSNPVKLVKNILSVNAMLREVRVEAPIYPTTNACYIHQELQQRCSMGMAENLGTIEQVANNAVLSRIAEQCIGESRQLSDLTWIRNGGITSNAPRAVVHAQGPRGNIYSLNLLTGDFLINGYFFDKLPASIRGDSTYRRTFSDLDFKISRSSNGAFTTQRVFNDSRYEFREELHTSGAPRIVCSEVKQVGGELVHFDVLPLEEVRQFLPASLVERFTHWYCKKYGVLLMKTLLDTEQFKTTGNLFNETKFVVLNLKRLLRRSARQSHQHPSSPVEWVECRQVPRQLCMGSEVAEHLVAGRLIELLSTDLPSDRKQLICVASTENDALTSILSVLSKFEAQHYIDVYSSLGKPSSVIEIEFTRYGLRFCFDASNGIIYSQDHTDYHVAAEQVLPGQLAPFQFTNFLLLKRTDTTKVHLDEFLVLVPDGWVDVSCTEVESQPIEPTAHVDPTLTPSTLSWDSTSAKELANGAAGPSALLERKLDWRTRKYFSYKIKQEGAPLEARSFPAWLQLACLYAISDSPVPEPSCSRFPYVVAMDIVRKAMVNRPLTSAELYKLSNLLSVINSELRRCLLQGYEILGARLGNVKLLAQSLYSFSESVNFCYSDTVTKGSGGCKWRTELISTVEAQIRDLRGQSMMLYCICPQLTADEEREQFGFSMKQSLLDKTERRLNFAMAGLLPYQTRSDCVSQLERKLRSTLLKLKPKICDGNSDMPNIYRLTIATKNSTVGKNYLDKQQQSWDAFLKEEHFELKRSNIVVLAETLLQEQAASQQEQSHCFKYIARALCATPNAAKLASNENITEAERRDAFMMQIFEKFHLTNDNRFAQISNDKEQNHAAFLADMNMIFLEKERIGRLNPFLNKPCIDEVHRVVQLFLELEVMNEKFLRMISSHCGITDRKIPSPRVLETNVSRTEGLLVQELSCVRKWCPVKHPGWLAFEVENRLQIRPQQYDIAALCIDHPNSIAQLNMGEGKTRVIIPMLVIEFTHSRSLVMPTTSHPPIMRITILRALISEFVEYLTQTLQHSVFARRVYVTPFNRDVEIDCPKNAKKLLDTFMECAMNGGVLVETPESRMSKLLKLQELQMKASDYCRANEGQRDKRLDEAVNFLRKVVEFPAVDVLDEADEELNNKYQLIYAVCGKEESTNALPSGEIRWNVLQAIYRVFHNCSPEVEDFVATHQTAVCRGEVTTCGRFRPVRFIADQKEWKQPQTKRKLSSIILNELLNNPPYELKCLKALAEGSQLAYVQAFVLEPERTHTSDRKFMQIDKEQVCLILLCLRGYLSSGVVWNALEKRHRVEYGLNLKAGKKQLAVPYRASDTPAERAEYGHPDIALALTVLSWYYDGLTESALRQCFAALLRKGKVARQQLYKTWFKLATESVDREEMERLQKIDTIEKVDLQNEEQFNLLFKTFRFNLETINVYLNSCIFPVETRQYPHKIVANAFHLAESRGHTVGFSGTKDNSLLLPPEVEQKTLKHLLGTDAKMIACVAKDANQTYHAGPSCPGVSLSLVLSNYLYFHSQTCLLLFVPFPTSSGETPWMPY